LLKIVFAVIGFQLTHSLFGGTAGLLIGWYIERLIKINSDRQQQEAQAQRRRGRTAEEIYNYYQTRSSYTSDMPTILVALSAAVMKADGKALKIELNYIKSFLKQQFGDQFTPQHLQKLKYFLNSDIPIAQICSDIRLHLGQQARQQIVFYLFKIAQADQQISASERNVIANIASLIGVARIDFDRIQQSFTVQEHKTDSNYQLLGLNKNATLQEVKTAYRQLSKKFHPDTVAHKGEEAQIKAKEQFQKIQAAYQAIVEQYQ